MEPHRKPSLGETARKYLTGAGGLIPLSWACRVPGAGPLVVCYHAVSDRELPHLRPLFHYLSVPQFEQDLDALCSRFSFMDLEQIYQGMSGARRLPRNSCHLTFDDGLREVTEVIAPLLKRRGIPATFFVNSPFLDNRHLFYRFKSALLFSRLENLDATPTRDRVAEILRLHGCAVTPAHSGTGIMAVTFAQRAVLDELAPVLGLDWAEYLRTERPFMDTAEVSRLLQDGFAVGAHSLDHALYRDLPLAEQLRQTREDMRQLTARFTLSRRVFAFPFHARGVSPEFYETLLQDGSIELFFGSGGWFHERPRRLVNRVLRELESTAISPLLRQSFALDAARKLFRG